MFFRNDCPKSVLLASLALFLAGCGGGGGDPDADGDGDGFTNAEETMAGSDPNNALSIPNDIDADGVANDMDDDIDGDGLLDSWEETYGLGYSSISDATGINGPDGDPDRDGIDNMAEHDAGSDPNNALSTPDDIDGDGFTNAEETMAGSDPNNALSIPNDADGDGFSDAEEIMAGSDPNLAASIPDDIDGDGFTNAAEMTAGSNPNLAASTPDDIDGDGFTNAAEMMAGSNPNLAASTPDDIDGDGFTNAAEMMAGSDPNLAASTPNDIDGDGVANDMDEDRDGDGLLDSWEETYSLGYSSISDATGINGPDGDPDSDGFTNAAEMTAGSDPNLVASTPNDIDGDGFSNTAEMTAGSDPNLAASTPNDIDGDGFTNAAEMTAGSDPNNALSIPNDIDGDGVANDMDEDRDGDGLLDSWEETYGLGYSSISDATGINGPDGDPDSDGFDNMAEYLAGSYPNFAASTPNDIDGDGFTNAADTNPRLFDRTLIVANNIDDTASVNAGDAGFTLSGEAANDNLGYSVSSAGDVNGDGIDDVIVGATGVWKVLFSDAGAAYVIYGTDDDSHMDIALATDALAAADGFRILGAAADDELGYSVSGAGDVNGDGIDDLIVGAYDNDAGGSNAGAAYVIYGQDSTVENYVDRGELSVSTFAGTDYNGADGFHILGAAANDRLGASVSAAGDVNGDGIDDVIVGAYGVEHVAGDINAGAAYVIYGQDSTVENYVDRGNIDVGDTTSFSASVGFRIRGAAAERNYLGDTVSGAGDVNGDGIADLIVGARGFNTFRGAAYVIYGKDSLTRGNIDVSDTTSFSASVGFRINGTVDGFLDDRLGYSVSGAGDVNGDGMDDVIVGARLNDEGGSNAGAAYVIYGQDGVTRGNINVGDMTSFSASVGFTINGAAAGDNLGNSVSGAGDVNGDGIDDVIVGARYSHAGSFTGAAYVIYGQDSTVDNYVDRGDLNVSAFAGTDYNGADGFRLSGAAAQDELGYSVSGAGDVNGDGYDDVIVGAYGVSTDTGAAYVLLSPPEVPESPASSN